MNEPEPGDEQLMARITTRDEQALAELYRRHAPVVMGLARRILGDQALAEEVTQETFWRAWNRADTYRPASGAVGGWLYGIARNLAIDRLRRGRRRPVAVDLPGEDRAAGDLVDPAADVPEIARRARQASLVRRALQALPPEQLAVIELAYFQGLTRREIAESESLPLGTVHTRARLALLKLRELLRPEDSES